MLFFSGEDNILGHHWKRLCFKMFCSPIACVGTPATLLLLLRSYTDLYSFHALKSQSGLRYVKPWCWPLLDRSLRLCLNNSCLHPTPPKSAYFCFVLGHQVGAVKPTNKSYCTVQLIKAHRKSNNKKNLIMTSYLLVLFLCMILI